MITDRAVAACWDANAETWTKHVRAGYDAFRALFHDPAFVAFVGDLSERLVLDAGCGEGTTTRLFARRGARMVGVDLSAKMIAAARAEETRAPLGVRYEVASLSDLSLFPEETFDACLSTMALTECADYEGAVREIHRVLVPGGRFAFSLCHPCFTYEVRGWEYDDDGECVGVRLGAYFDDGVYEEQWRFSGAPPEEQERVEPFTTLSVRRTLTDLLNPLCEVGFRLERLLEPRPAAAACRRDPSLRRHQAVPHTLFVQASKAEESGDAAEERTPSPGREPGGKERTLYPAVERRQRECDQR